ncbi:enoyl-CoA hydratase/isomerase family protein [Alcaligenaceae bacterium]|nr:enoyl-CoA hydratase/isomerase family protein [Alcaligenaceae bacterium]
MTKDAGGLVQTERRGDTIILWLNRPEELNRLSTEGQFLELADKIRQANLDPTARALIITGKGKAFCAGGDLHKMANREGFSAGTPQDIRMRYKETIHQVPLALNDVDIPTIAAVNGPAYGAGCDLACMCDIRIASPDATFCVSFAELGIISGDGGSWILPRLVGRSTAMAMTFTASPIDATEALRCGLVTQLAEPGQLLESALALAERIASHPRNTIRMAKQLLRSAEHTSLPDHLDMAAALQAIAHTSEEHIVAVNRLIQRLQNKSA